MSCAVNPIHELGFYLIQIWEAANMKRKQCVKNEQGEVLMTAENLKICLRNQPDSFETLELNESLHLQYYQFSNIDNLAPFTKLHTLFLNNNAISIIQNLSPLKQLVTLNLSFNRIAEFKNLNQLHNLYSLDLSSNRIQSLPQLQLKGLNSLNNLKLAHNKLTTYESIKSITELAPTLTYLDLSFNQQLDYDLCIFNELLGNLKISVLALSNTLLSRSTPNYRKQIINSIKALKFLDDRPVTEQERMLAQAWKEGGLVLQKQVRAKIKQKTIQKNSKILTQIEQRSKIVQEKRSQVFSKLTTKQTKKLKELNSFKQSQDYSLMNEEEKTIINLQIEELQKYLELMIEAVCYIDLDKQLNQGKVQLPKMIIDKETPETIYVYNVSQEQIPLIAQKYYPQETRPIIPVNYEQPKDYRWIKQYDELLHGTYEQSRGNLQMLIPLFNLGLFELDSSLGRKVRRFELEQLKHHLKSMRQQEQKRQRSIQALDELD